MILVDGMGDEPESGTDSRYTHRPSINVADRESERLGAMYDALNYRR